mgnify:CR=1 FL=1
MEHDNPIPAGQKRLMAVGENSHRSDDENFLMIHGKKDVGIGTRRNF